MNLEFRKKRLNQRTSEVANTRLWYFASAIDLATGACFLIHPNMRLGSKNKQAPKVDFLSSKSEAQPASE